MRETEGAQEREMESQAGADLCSARAWQVSRTWGRRQPKALSRIYWRPFSAQGHQGHS